MKTDYSRLSNKNFVFVVNSYNVFGGAERQAMILANYIRGNISKNVFFVGFEDGEGFKKLLQEQNFKTYHFAFNHKASKFTKVIQYWKLVNFMKSIKPEILIPYVAESNKIVAQIWNYTGAQFAFWNQREEGRKLYGTSLEKKLINKVSAIVSNSFEGKNALVKTYGLKNTQVHVINNGIVPFEKESEHRDWHEELEVDKERPLISMIANITSRKDHKTLIKAWKMVIERCKEEHKTLPFLVLAGRKDNMYDEVRLLAFDLKLSDHLAFVGALNPVQPLIEGSYFCVFSSNLEGCPNGVLECMERGKAVVGTNISGLRQALGDAYADKCLSDPNNPKDLAKKIIDLYDNPLLVEELGVYNKNRIETDFSVKGMADQHLKIVLQNLEG